MIPIVFSTDHNYVMPTGITLYSLLAFRGQEEYDIYILISESVTEGDKKILQDQVKALSTQSKLTFVEMGDKYKGGYEIRGISKACYYRLMIPWLIPHVDKIIYSDVDVIFKTSLKDLYQIDLEGKFVAGAYPSTEKGWVAMKKYFSKIGLDYKGYINSGMLVINSKLQREEELKVRYDQLSEKKFLYQDQDIINIVCKDRIAYFDKRFNLRPDYFAVSEELSHNVVIHYAGEKPWNAFTYAWAQWWTPYFKSVFFDGRLYQEVSAKVLNPIFQIKFFLKKLKCKIQQIRYIYFY